MSSVFVEHAPCEKCGSSDAKAVYSDGHTHCFKCGQRTSTRGSPRIGECTGVPDRKLTAETCKLWSYWIDDKGTHHMPWFKDGQVVAEKLRSPSKEFSWRKRREARGLYGQWLWPEGGRMLTITEGELDALSMSQAQGNKWPVVSLPDGASSARSAIQESLEWVESFDTVVLMFDQDEAGQEATTAAAAIIKPGKVKIARLPLKDPSEMLVAGRSPELISAMWNAKQWRPSGIVSSEQVLEMVLRPIPPSDPYPLVALNTVTGGLRRGELTMFAAGSGSGKSTLVRQTAHALRKLGRKVGYVALEESVQVSALCLYGLELNRNIKLDVDPQKAIRDDPDRFVEYIGGYELYDHWGSQDPDDLLSRIRYMIVGCGCEYVVLDHISIVVSGNDQDERRAIDKLMTALRALVHETGAGLLVITHLKRGLSGQGWETGKRPSLSDLRGSGGLEQLSDTVIVASRDMTADPPVCDQVSYFVVKNRWVSRLGPAGTAVYNHETGALEEVLFGEF
jgi:twinkle protein